ncbi:MAG TPA: response regulator transcription factor [Blastocatellia bacterium]|nr:response regulator transcription factor [Blastocatellia bacterium]
MVKVLIADDHTIVREGLKQILAQSVDLSVTGEAANGGELLEKVRTGDWDVVLLDLNMPGRDGLDTLKQLKCERPKLPVLVLSMYPEEQYAVRILKAGASGYLNKRSAPEQLIEAIRRVSSGGKYISAAMAEKLAFELETNFQDALHNSLSDREYQVLCLLASGKTRREVAEELSLSVKSISTYRARILEKLRLKSNAELTHYAIQHGLVD